MRISKHKSILTFFESRLGYCQIVELKNVKIFSTYLDLFAGCGLSLGFEAVGFQTQGFEMVRAAAQT